VCATTPDYFFNLGLYLCVGGNSHVVNNLLVLMRLASLNTIRKTGMNSYKIKYI
jgi:hypothetical protein